MSAVPVRSLVDRVLVPSVTQSICVLILVKRELFGTSRFRPDKFCCFVRNFETRGNWGVFIDVCQFPSVSSCFAYHSLCYSHNHVYNLEF